MDKIAKYFKKNIMSIAFIAIYLAAIVSANLIITFLGPKATIITAFALIGLDLTARDRLHELWNRKGLWLKMAMLIVAGSVISFLINSNSLIIAIASCIAFFGAGLVDFIVYSILYKRAWLVKVNGSNLFSSLTDSMIFPTLAFSSFMPLIIAGQFAAKALGGFAWSLVLRK